MTRASARLGLEGGLALRGEPLDRELEAGQEAFGLAPDVAHAGQRVARLVTFRGGSIAQLGDVFTGRIVAHQAAELGPTGTDLRDVLGLGASVVSAVARSGRPSEDECLDAFLFGLAHALTEVGPAGQPARDLCFA